VKAFVLLDAGPLVAYLDPHDTYHDWAVARWRELEPPLLTGTSRYTARTDEK